VRCITPRSDEQSHGHAERTEQLGHLDLGAARHDDPGVSGTVPAGGINVAGKTLTISFYMASSTGNAKFNVVLYDVTTGTTIADSGVVGVSNSSGAAVLQNFTAVIPSSGVSIGSGDALQWKFTLSGSGQLPTFYYNSQADNSRSSICDTTLTGQPEPGQVGRSAQSGQRAARCAAVHADLCQHRRHGSQRHRGGHAAGQRQLCQRHAQRREVTPGQSGQQLTFSNVKSSTDSTAGQVAAGASGSIVIHATAGSGATGTLTNNASFSATGLSAVQASASTTIGSPAGGSPSLSQQGRQQDLLTAGDSATYTLTLVNVGSGRPLRSPSATPCRSPGTTVRGVAAPRPATAASRVMC
jgi:hypothetical protein